MNGGMSMHNTVSAIEHDIEQLESPNSNISDEALQDIERRIVDQKTKIRESLSPSKSREAERLNEIAGKVNSNISSAFDRFDSVKQLKDYLEPIFQRGKIDTTYGRALVLIEETKLIEYVKDYFNKPEDDYELCHYIVSKAIELSDKIMTDQYTALLKLELRFFDQKFAGLK